MDEFLTIEEIRFLTGRSTSAKQKEWLTKNGFPFLENDSRFPVVNRFVCREKMAGLMTADSEPDFSQVK